MPSVTQKFLDRVWLELDQHLPHWRKLDRSLSHHGDMPFWERALQSLPRVSPSHYSAGSAITIGAARDLSSLQTQQLRQALQNLHPWRKGPFCYFGIHVDSEWRSELKWQRLQQGISALTDRRVLDVGCGNGYYGWRMLQAGARQVVGIDPARIFLLQYFASQHYLENPRNLLLPLTLEDLPPGQQEFDSVFSMGVLSHRRDPTVHLKDLHARLVPGGELVLETLVIEGAGKTSLRPEGRYARMRNVWLLPTPGLLAQWLEEAGYSSARLLDLSATTPEEQRSTDWMRFESLSQGLDAQNPCLTVEGHPAPKRAIFIAEP